jgi:Rrf2 family protein
MKLSTRTRYGTRLMLSLALHHGGGPVDVKGIAQLENISEKYLGQIIIPLKTAGLVRAFRGAYGGYTLAKAPIDITVYDIANIIEGWFDLVECLGDPSKCERFSTCVTSQIWANVKAAMVRELKSVSLQDLVDKFKARKPEQFNYEI